MRSGVWDAPRPGDFARDGLTVPSTGSAAPVGLGTARFFDNDNSSASVGRCLLGVERSAIETGRAPMAAGAGSHRATRPPGPEPPISTPMFALHVEVAGAERGAGRGSGDGRGFGGVRVWGEGGGTAGWGIVS